MMNNRDTDACIHWPRSYWHRQTIALKDIKLTLSTNVQQAAAAIAANIQNILVRREIFAIAAADIGEHAARRKACDKLLDLWPRRMSRLAKMIRYFIIDFVYVFQLQLGWTLQRFEFTTGSGGFGCFALSMSIAQRFESAFAWIVFQTNIEKSEIGVSECLLDISRTKTELPLTCEMWRKCVCLGGRWIDEHRHFDTHRFCAV